MLWRTNAVYLTWTERTERSLEKFLLRRKFNLCDEGSIKDEGVIDNESHCRGWEDYFFKSALTASVQAVLMIYAEC